VISQEDAKILHEQLKTSGGIRMPTPTGDLFLVDARVFQKAGLLIASSNGGCFLWDYDRPLNAFRLLSAKFPLGIAETVSNIANALGALEQSLEQSLVEPPLLEYKDPPDGSGTP